MVIAGTFQSALNCANDWDPNCDYTELTFNSSTGLYRGTFLIPEGNNRYKVTIGGSWDINYGENGIRDGADIFLCVPSGSEEITFAYDPSTHLVSTSPLTSGISPDCLPLVVLAGSFQDELDCFGDWVPDCSNSALLYNSCSGLFEGDFNVPSGCYDYRVVLGNSWQNSFGQEGIHNGLNYIIYIPQNPDIHFTYDPVTHVVISTPYTGVPQEVTNISLIGSLQDELGCDYDGEYDCNKPALILNSETGAWEGSFTLPSGCYFYRVKEIFVCNNVAFYGENGIEWGNDIQLNIPKDAEITFSYDPQTHILSSTPYSVAAQGVAKISLIGTLQDELGSAYDYNYECEYPALTKNEISGQWEGSFMLPAGCYKYSVQQTDVCGNINYYSGNGVPGMSGTQLIIPSSALITFSYDPETHIINSTPYNSTELGITNISLYGTFQTELGCDNDYDYDCDIPALTKNEISGLWEGNFIVPAGCYSYKVKETIGCNDINYYGENGEIYGNYITLFVPLEGEISFSYDPQTHIMISIPYTDVSTVNQCPENISVNNSTGICGAILDYPEFMVTVYYGGEIISITQTEDLSSGSFFPIGTTTNTFVLTKITGEEKTCSFDVVVTDTEAPVISNLNQVYEPLWPPNHKMVPVFIEYLASDNCNIASAELFISSNEPETGQGNGDLAPDWEILDEHNLSLRAERSAKGDGREYYITIKVTDDPGNLTEQFVTVRVSHDKGKKSEEFIIPELSDNKYILYPNAADEIINIKGLRPTTNSAYVICDMVEVIKKQGTILDEQVELETLPSGVYIFKFETDSGYIFKKFIKN